MEHPNDYRPCGGNIALYGSLLSRRQDLFYGLVSYLGCLPIVGPPLSRRGFHNLNNASDAVDKTLAWRNSWEIPDITRCTDEATLVRDPLYRAEVYRNLQRSLQTGSPFIILFQERALFAMRKEVTGLEVGLTSDQIHYERVSK